MPLVRGSVGNYRFNISGTLTVFNQATVLKIRTNGNVDILVKDSNGRLPREFPDTTWAPVEDVPLGTQVEQFELVE